MGISKQPLLVIAGPTSSGKSDLAIKIARKFSAKGGPASGWNGAEIISADSRQVYRGMYIGTGKVTKVEQRLAKHWLLDVASPKRQYSVAQWKRAAQHAIADIARHGKLPIVCGGTGFWIDSLVYDASLPEVKPNPKLRATLEKLSTDVLFARIRDLDSVRAKAIDRHNRRRLIRALEIVLTTGRPVSRSARSREAGPYNTLYLAISVDKKMLANRIERRLDMRLKQGMIAEVKKIALQRCFLEAAGVLWPRIPIYFSISSGLKGSTFKIFKVEPWERNA